LHITPEKAIPVKPGSMLRGTCENGSFDLAVTLECGQVFGWTRYDAAYLGIIKGRAVSLTQVGGRVEFDAETGARTSDITRYLGLDDDLKAILASVRVDPFMKRVLKSVRGLRLLKQDPWHCLCSYLLSSNNRVERIDKSVKEIARRWGVRHSLGGREIFELPAPRELARCDEPGIKACGAGFRSPYILRAARKVAEGTIDLGRIERMPYEEAKETLITLDGVGDKIADCVLLFALSKSEAFPIDVWIKKAIEKVYFKSRSVNIKEIHRFARDHFGPYAGYAQEYIYYYARTHGLD
jgi:N-glycosylase/DNA lyase